MVDDFTVVPSPAAILSIIASTWGDVISGVGWKVSADMVFLSQPFKA